MYALQSRGRGLLTSRMDSSRFHLLIIIYFTRLVHTATKKKNTVVANRPQPLSTAIRDKYERCTDKTDKK